MTSCVVYHPQKTPIRTSILSKRLINRWTYVINLIVKPDYDIYSLSNFFSFVDKTLTECRQLKLDKFSVNSLYGYQFESQVNNWIHYAISCNVQDFHLSLCNKSFRLTFVLDQFFFINSCFSHVSLSDCILNPTGEISWKNLKSLSISYGKLNEDLIENILFGSPLLEILKLVECYGYRRLDITSKGVKNLVFYGYFDHHDLTNSVTIEINTPNILPLTIQKVLFLSKLLLVDVSSLVEANLDCKIRGGFWEEVSEEEEEEEEKTLKDNTWPSWCQET